MMAKAGPGAGYWGVLEPYWEKIDIYRGPDVFLRTYSLTPPVVRDLFAAHFCESEVSNGGLHQFFINPTGVLAPEARDAFERVGFRVTAAVLAEAMAFFGNPYPREQEIRATRLEAIPGKTREKWDPFLALTEQFYKTLGPKHTPFFNALDSYALSGKGKRRRTRS
jgi:hypothetical protein